MRIMKQTMEQQEAAGRHGSTLLGNSPHDRPVSRVTFSSLKESLRRSLPRHFTPVRSRTTTELSTRFQGMAESFWSDGVQNQKPNPGPGPYRLPLVGPEARQKNAPGGPRSFSSSADEFRPAIPRSGWSPPGPVSASPARSDYHALPRGYTKTGTFYFARKRNFLLCLDTRPTQVVGGCKT